DAGRRVDFELEAFVGVVRRSGNQQGTTGFDEVRARLAAEWRAQRQCAREDLSHPATGRNIEQHEITALPRRHPNMDLLADSQTRSLDETDREPGRVVLTERTIGDLRSLSRRFVLTDTGFG